MTDNENKYWAFLSYSHQDNRGQRSDTVEAGSRCWGDWLHEALETFSIPAELVGKLNGRGEIIPERIYPIFRDEPELPGEAGLSADIRKALEQSICLIVVCSPRSAQSLRVNEVVRYFKQLGRGKQILPIVVAGEPNASDGNKPDKSVADECFVPALRHPVLPDGTLDATRQAERYIFVDARQGVEKREILAKDHRHAEADLEMAKIQLIALLIGVGFNGLWWREQRRHFLDFAAAQQQAREALNQVEEARRQLQAAQNRVLEIQNLPRDVQGQFQEAQNQALEAWNQAREARSQLQESQNKFQDTQAQLEEARNRALAAESKVLEAQNQAREAQKQLEEIRNQAPEAQNTQSQLEEIRAQAQDAQDKLLATQSQVQEFQNKVRDTETQLEEARNRALAAESKVLEAQNQAREAQKQLEEIRNQAPEAQNTQSQLEEIRTQAQDAQDKLLAAQNQVQEFQNRVRDTETQLEEARNRALAAESKVLEAQDQNREVQNIQSQLEETRTQAQDARNNFLAAQSQVQEFQNQARSAQSQLEEARDQVHATQSKVQEAQSQAREAQDQIQVIQNQTRDAQNQIKEAQKRSRNARRLTRALAVLAVLALMSAALTASMVWRQRKAASQALATADSEVAGKFDLPPGESNPEQVQQVLQNIDGAEQAENRRRSLDQLAVEIPRGEIPEALKTSSVILNDQQRSHFQKWLLIRLGWVNPVSAMTCANAIEGKIEDNEGMSDSNVYFQLAVLDNWMKTDLTGAFSWVCQLPESDARQRALEKLIPVLATNNPPDTLSRLNALSPVPDDRIYQLLFLRWAANDPVQAIEQRQQIPRHDQGDTILCAIMKDWMDQAPAAALNWVKSQPDSESRNRALEICVGELAKTDVPAALALAESLPEGTWLNLVISSLAGQADPSAALEWINRLEAPPEIMQQPNVPLVPLPWTKFLLNANFRSVTIFPMETEVLSNATNGPIPIKPKE